MNFIDLPRNNTKIDEKLDFVETKREMDNQDLLFNIIEKQAKEFEEFGKRMSVELHTSYQEYFKQKNEFKFYSGIVEPGVTCCECREKTELINSFKARIQELENDSYIKSQSIKQLQKDVQSLFDIIVKEGKTNIEKKPDIVPAKITITTIEEEEEEEVNINDFDAKEIEKDRLSVESFQYNIKDCYSDSAIDLFTDDEDDSSTTGGSVRSEDSDYVHKPPEWLDISPTLTQRAKIDKRNLDRWNSKMASNGLIPIKLVGKVDAEREKKYQTHRKRYSTSAIWLKTYESKQNQKPNKDDKFKIPSFGFTFNTTEDTKKKEASAPISLKSSVSTSVSELSTTSLATLQSCEVFSTEYHKNTFNSKSQQILSQYK